MSGKSQGLTRRDVGLAALGSLALTALPSGAAWSQASADREDTLILEVWPGGTTFRNYNNMNPYTVGNDLRNHILFIYEGLFYWHVLTDELVPYLASGYKYNDDYTQATVTLRQGVTWSDGTPFTADDVVFTLEMLRKNGAGKNDLFFASDISNVLKEAKKVDDYTVVFELKQRDPRFVMRDLAVKFNKGMHIMPAHIFSKIEDLAAYQNFDLEKGIPVGTGPYKIVQAVPERVVMDRRDDWWGAKPGMWNADQAGKNYTDLPVPKRIIARPRAETQQAAQQIVSKQIDWMVEAPVPIMKQILQTPFITTLTDRKPPFGYVDWWPTSLHFNLDSPLVSDKNVRLAIRYAVNAQQVIDIFHEGAADLSYSPFPDFKVLRPYIEDLTPIAKEKGYGVTDRNKSAEYMQKAGYTKDSEGFWAKDGKRWQAVMHGALALELAGPIIVEQLRRAGFSISWFSRADSGVVVNRGQVDLALWGHAGSTFDPQDTLLLYHSKFYRPIGESTSRFNRWRNKDFDAIVDKVGTYPVNAPELRPLVKEAMTIWLEDVVEVPISQWYHRIPTSTAYWKGWPTEANPYATSTVSHWTTIFVVHGLSKA